jgi:hypothetical protein
LLNLWNLRKYTTIPPVIYALRQQEINDHALLTALDESSIETLVYIEFDTSVRRTITYQVTHGHKSLIRITKVFKHYKLMGSPKFDWLDVTQDEFDHFRAHGYFADYSKRPFPLSPLQPPGTPMTVGSHLSSTSTLPTKV